MPWRPGPRSILLHVAGGRHQIEQVDDGDRMRHPEREVVQAGPAAIGEGDVVHAALAVRPGRPQPVRHLVLGVFGDAETNLVIERHRFVDVRREAIEMVDAQRLHALVERVLLMDRRQPVHAGIKLERHALDVARAQGARLKRAVDPFGRQLPRPEEVFRLIEVWLAEDLEAEGTDARLGPFAQHDAMVAALFQRAQTNFLLVLVGDLEAEGVDIKRTALAQIGDHSSMWLRRTILKGG